MNKNLSREIYIVWFMKETPTGEKNIFLFTTKKRIICV